MIYLTYLMLNTCFVPQELASVRMRRFLSTSGSREEKADAAAARRDRALHAWRNLGSPPPTRPRVQSYESAAKNSTVISTGFLVPGTSAAELYNKAVAAAASKPAAAVAAAPSGISGIRARYRSVAASLVYGRAGHLPANRLQHAQGGGSGR